MYEEADDVVNQFCGQSFGLNIMKLRSYRSKAKRSMTIVRHWKDKCLATRQELSQLEDAYESQRAELVELQTEHWKICDWLSHSSDPHQRHQAFGLKISKLKRHSLMSQEDEFLRSQSKSMQRELSDEPQFKMSKVVATFSSHPYQPKDPPPAHVCFSNWCNIAKDNKVKAPILDAVRPHFQ